MGFTQFIRERQYLHNVSPSTVSWYAHALKWLLSRAFQRATQRHCNKDAREGPEGYRLQLGHSGN